MREARFDYDGEKVFSQARLLFVDVTDPRPYERGYGGGWLAGFVAAAVRPWSSPIHALTSAATTEAGSPVS
jgi:hypothetical protein